MAERFTGSDLRDHDVGGIDVSEQAAFDQPIERAPTAITAFVGRTLRGPLNRPVRVASFADFQRTFGGLWQPSTLAYAVEQYFDNGGGVALVVRVANGARPCTLVLPCGPERLVLQALAPGTREYLRAAVDYDGIGDNEQDAFNLVLQRVRSAGSEYVEDQEIYRRITMRPDSSRFAASALLASQLVRVLGDVPPVRPDRTVRRDGRQIAAYVLSNPDGDDGAPLTDYDVIGSAARGTGVFALDAGTTFNLLYVPPLARDVDVGASTLLVANRLCRERRALLVVDPPRSWADPQLAIDGARDLAFASDSAAMFYPHVLAFDKLRGRFEPFAPGGAAAGLLARADVESPPWSAAAGELPVLRPGFRPSVAITESERHRLAAQGVNALQSVRMVSARRLPARTLAGPTGAAPDWRWLAARRLAHCIVASLEHGTRWMVFEPNEPALWRRGQAQVEAFFRALEHDGAFAGRADGDRWFVACDERVNRERERELGTVNVLYGFAAARPGEFHVFLLSHRAGESRTLSVSLNRLQGHLHGQLQRHAALPGTPADALVDAVAPALLDRLS